MKQKQAYQIVYCCSDYLLYDVLYVVSYIQVWMWLAFYVYSTALKVAI